MKLLNDIADPPLSGAATQEQVAVVGVSANGRVRACMCVSTCKPVIAFLESEVRIRRPRIEHYSFPQSRPRSYVRTYTGSKQHRPAHSV